LNLDNYPFQRVPPCLIVGEGRRKKGGFLQGKGKKKGEGEGGKDHSRLFDAQRTPSPSFKYNCMVNHCSQFQSTIKKKRKGFFKEGKGGEGKVFAKAVKKRADCPPTSSNWLAREGEKIKEKEERGIN